MTILILFLLQIKVFEEGAARASPGGLWAFDMREGGSDKPVRLILVQIQIQTQIQVQIQIQTQIQTMRRAGLSIHKKASDGQWSDLCDPGRFKSTPSTLQGVCMLYSYMKQQARQIEKKITSSLQ